MPQPPRIPAVFYQYRLVGVIVHTGSADGGHYYSFVLDRSSNGSDKNASKSGWFEFNDTTVQAWNPADVAGACFGGVDTIDAYDVRTNKTGAKQARGPFHKIRRIWSFFSQLEHVRRMFANFF
jgi:hypothetical protein